ncbi:tRNA pseudouridine(55) synthase TruB [Blastopirellula marina]|uniref:tRNA pseudouridine synthase B n=1 Tax=Blastopirellula marina TaxID=124 RepID=A0A2S8GEY8_9BACT|nr:tRNA pseudouridine(55) synthase TruB [Blastopirellula marina]PQO42654.1 tRNA pseudouridine(55) synthase TruB [Blastopirellula marina]PTL46420.1 tRNA pseudouridine(55) synthase TruB [Blastopirellula marina]
MHGILNLNKPAGMTSRDVVNIVQRLIRPVKTGHAGTLDPLATGVLVCPVGHGTKLIEYVQRLPKTYVATFLLGQQSDTEDIEGNVQTLVDPPQPTLAEIEAALPPFLGRISQVPPAFSALKVAGKRAYDLARQGKQVELAAREIEVYSLSILGYEYPELKLEIVCGSGTYVRSLGRDLARSLGTEAIMSALERTAIGDFRLENALNPTTDFDRETIERSLLPTVQAVQALPQVTAGQQDIVRLSQGKLISVECELPGSHSGPYEVAVLNGEGCLVAVVQPGKEGGWRSVKNFANDYL